MQLAAAVRVRLVLANLVLQVAALDKVVMQAVMVLAVNEKMVVILVLIFQAVAAAALGLLV